MSPRCLPLACLLLAGCPPQTPPGPPPGDPPPIVGGAASREGGPHDADTRAAPPAPDDPDAPDEPGDAEAGERPAPKLSAPRADTQLADTLPPPKGRAGVPERRGVAGGCEGGTRRAGDTWKVDCNECSCGDDGQTTCTAMACGGPSPAR
jgi:hypothetical protein